MSKQKVGRTSSTGRIPRPSTRVQRAEGEGEISEVENLILGQIRNYFDLPFSRHFQKFDENELANRILKMISEMELPTQLNIFYCLDPMDLNPNHPGPLPREDIDLFLVTVGNYILEISISRWPSGRLTCNVRRSNMPEQIEQIQTIHPVPELHYGRR